MEFGPARKKKAPTEERKSPSPEALEAPAQQQEAPTPEQPALDIIPSLGIEISPDEAARFVSYLRKSPDLCPGIGRLSSQDLEALQHQLTTDVLAPAFADARLVELGSKSGSKLPQSTRREYQGAIRRLQEAHPQADAFDQFSMLTISNDWDSVSTRGRAKAALNDLATRTLLEGMPALLEAFQHFQAQEIQREFDRTGDRETALRRQAEAKLVHDVYEKWITDRYSSTFLKTRRRSIDAQMLLMIARAAQYLHDYKPDIHGLRAWRTASQKALEAKGRKANTPKSKAPLPSIDDLIDRGASELEAKLEVERVRAKRDKRGPNKAKKTTLSMIAKLEHTRRKTDPGFDMRTAIWREVMADTRITDDKRACIAASMTLGCRPIELAEGVQVFALKAADTDDHYRLVMRVAGSKLSDASFLEEENLLYKMTPDERAAVDALAANQEVIDYNTKGQPWRFVEVACQADEARWLADFIRKQGLPREKTNVDNWAAEEREAFAEYEMDVTHEAVIKIPHRFRDGEAIARLSDAERGRRIVGGYSDLVARLGKQVFPRMKERLTPYVLRHAYSSDMKALGGDLEDRSAALGHTSGRTISRYGSAQHSKHKAHRNRASQCVKIKQAKPVRNLRSANKTYGPKAGGNARKPK